MVDKTRSGTSRFQSWYDTTKAKYPTYSWGAAPTNRQEFRDLQSAFETWNRQNRRQKKRPDTTTTTPTTPPVTPPTPKPPVIPASNKWNDIVSAYFPEGYKAGGLVRGGGCAQRGTGRGKMR